MNNIYGNHRIGRTKLKKTPLTFNLQPLTFNHPPLTKSKLSLAYCYKFDRFGYGRNSNLGKKTRIQLRLL